MDSVDRSYCGASISIATKVFPLLSMSDMLISAEAQEQSSPRVIFFAFNKGNAIVLRFYILNIYKFVFGSEKAKIQQGPCEI
jgi:hypothetical protein